jgi:hypothetical protein
MNNYPIIIWIHSPIGYETYLAIKAIDPSKTIIPISSRNVTVPGSMVNIGLPGLFQIDSDQQRNHNLLKLSSSIKGVAEKYGGYILLAPQTAQPYIEIIIESEHCKGFGIYDEGGNNYKDTWSNFTKPSFHQYQIKKTTAWIAAAKELKFNIDKLINRHASGVPFYDITHSKFVGLFSLFDEAFPGMDKIKLNIHNDSKSFNESIEKFSLILCGDLTNIRNKESSNHRHFNNINQLLKITPNQNWVIKPHPNDRSESILKNLDYPVQTWEKFCLDKTIDLNREAVFMNFKLYVAQDNSSIQYLKCLRKKNFMIIS